MERADHSNRLFVKKHGINSLKRKAKHALIRKAKMNRRPDFVARPHRCAIGSVLFWFGVLVGWLRWRRWWLERGGLR